MTAPSCISKHYVLQNTLSFCMLLLLIMHQVLLFAAALASIVYESRRGAKGMARCTG
jgi:hypothetical protein